MKIHLVNAANQHLHKDLRDQFFTIRHSIYVDEKHWRDSDASRREIDQFDNDLATYLIGENDGEVMAGSRLVPTSEPHLLSEVFPEMAGLHGLIRQPDVAEWTRGFVVKQHRHGPAKNQICGAVMDYCLREGIAAIGGVQDCYWLPLWRRFGWVVREIGPRQKIAGRECVAAFFDVSEYARDKALLHGGLVRSPLVHEGPYRPFIASKDAAHAA